MLLLVAMFHGVHLQVLNLMISKEEILEQSNLNTLHLHQVQQDNHIKIQTSSELKVILNQSRNQLWSRKILDKELKILFQDLMF